MKVYASTLLATALACVAPAYALEIDPLVHPEINLGGRAIVSTDFESTTLANGARDRNNRLDISDTSLLFGFSKYLFNSRDYAFATAGFKSVEADTDLRDDIYLHQLFAGIGGKRYEILLGRTQLPNTLLSFPTLRDSDLLAYTHVGNAQVNAHAEEYQIYGGQVRGQYWFSAFVSARAAVTARAASDPANPARVLSDNFNGGTVTLAYDAPEAIKFARGLRYAGISVDSQRFDPLLGEIKGKTTALLAGLSLNLNSQPEYSWNLDLQGIVNRGEAVTSLAQTFQRARADSQAMVAALRYRHSPALQTRWQAALNLGWKDYADFTDASSIVIAPSYTYRLGSGVDFTGQYLYQRNQGVLATATGIDSEHRLMLGLSFAFAHTFNETVGERGDILNIEHNMLDFGPAGGGH